MMPAIDYNFRIAEAYGISEEELLEKKRPLSFLLRIGKITNDEFWDRLSSDLGKPLLADKNRLWQDRDEDTSLYPEMLKFVEELKNAGFKTAVLSDVIEPHIERVNKVKGYEGFDEVVLSCRVGLAKPDPNIYILTAKKLGVKPEECVFVDDHQKNLDPACELGMKTVLAKNSKQIIEDIKNLIK